MRSYGRSETASFAAPKPTPAAATALVRACTKYKVGLTGFAFVAGKTAPVSPFIFHFGTLKEDMDALRGVHEGLFDFMSSNSDSIHHKTIQKNDT